MTNAIAYARVSTEDQGRGWSLSTQFQAIRDYAARNGLDIINEFSDDETGTKLERTNFAQVRGMLRSGVAQALIVYTQDRLSRKLSDLFLLRDELQRQGVVIHFARHGRILGDSAESRAMDNVDAIFSEMEREKILERTARGRKGKIESGHYLGNGHPPFGYRVEGEGRTTRLVIDEEQAEIVRQIFRLFAYGDETGRLRASDIARRLREQGIPTPADLKPGFSQTKKRAFAEWDTHSIYPLLERSAYVGRFVNGRYRQTNGRRYRSTEDLTTIAVPAIVDEETWNAVQQRLRDGRQQSPRGTHYEYLVARRLKCVCGYHLIGRPSVHPRYPIPYLYYGCGGKKGNVRACSMNNLSVTTLDAIVWQWMKDILLNPAELEAELREQSAHLNQKRAALDAELARLYQRKEEINTELKRLLALYTRGIFSEEMLETEAAQKNLVLSSIEGEITNLERQRQSPLTEDRIEALRAFAEELQRGIVEAEQSFAARRQLVELMDVQVEMVWQDKELWLKITSDLGDGLLRFMSKSLRRRCGRTAPR